MLANPFTVAASFILFWPLAVLYQTNKPMRMRLGPEGPTGLISNEAASGPRRMRICLFV